MVSARARRILQRIGWAYVAYHNLIAAILVGSAINDIMPGYWRQTEFQLEMLSGVLMYPALVPSLFVCGGLHDRCTTLLGHAVQVTVFLTTGACYVMACWVLMSLMVRRFRRSSDGRHGHV